MRECLNSLNAKDYREKNVQKCDLDGCIVLIGTATSNITYLTPLRGLTP